MDNLTHSLFAVTVAGTRVLGTRPGTTATLVIASNAPDLDIAAALAGGAMQYLAEHRGPTHGPIGIVTLSVFSAALVRLFHHEPPRTSRPGGPNLQSRTTHPEPASLPYLLGVALVGLLCHVIMDFPTTYRIRLLDPFSPRWFGADWLPILDVYLLGILLLGLLAGMGWPAWRARWATAALGVMLAYYGLRATSHAAALDLARHLPRPAEAAGPARDTAALPTFFSPFHWRLVRQYPNGYELGVIGVGPGRRPLERTWLRHEENAWTHLAAVAEPARVFLEFARFPAAATEPHPDGTVTVRWVDLRFMEPSGAPRMRGGGLFAAVVRLGPDGSVLSARVGGD